MHPVFGNINKNVVMALHGLSCWRISKLLSDHSLELQKRKDVMHQCIQIQKGMEISDLLGSRRPNCKISAMIAQCTYREVFNDPDNVNMLPTDSRNSLTLCTESFDLVLT
jgi:hypothetical protein